jgi:tRNA(Ile2)-agmatinylcytidine synthase
MLFMHIKIHIGIDDTDSLSGGCTTYIGALVIEELLKNEKVKFLDYPNLIRLNPNIPWKTRGNGAIALRIEAIHNEVTKIEEEVIKKVLENAYIDENTEPTIAFLKGELPIFLKEFAYESVRRVVDIDQAVKIAERSNIKLFTLNDKKRGIIGAISAIGLTLDKGDYTFELLAYRRKENYGKKREINEKSVYEMDKLTSPYTFNNIDYEKNRILITPRGPDPVLFGIRGENPEILLTAFQKIKVYEPIERWVIYKTNQGTDMHYRGIKRIKELKCYDAVKLLGKISIPPKIIKGGHLILAITDECNDAIECAIYEPTKRLKKIAMQLQCGDVIKVYGVVKEHNNTLTINVEKLYVKKLEKIIRKRNPKCPVCGATMKSEGKNKGFECEKCKYKANINLRKEEEVILRNIYEGIYLPPPRSHRHLTKPLIRYMNERVNDSQQKMIKNWYWSETLHANIN